MHKQRIALWALAMGLAGVAGCGSVEVESTDQLRPPLPNIAAIASGGGAVTKLDLLVTVDNSRSMADKQRLLAEAIPDLVRGLASPPCVGPDGVVAGDQPQGPLDGCPPGTRRRFPPIDDIHIGVITSSLGGHGSDACPGVEKGVCPNGASNTTNDDAGHLVTRLGPCSGEAVETYQGKGFLAWDPAGRQSPPGEASLGSKSAPGIVTKLADMVIGAGQIGCGYEASLESWYRFLVDPEPYQTITVEGSEAVPKGVDQVLLRQRRDFLRPDSLLAIVALSDENDCSIQEYGQYYLAAQQRDPAAPNVAFRLPTARSECAKDPGDPCCHSCGQSAPGCPPDPGCDGEPLDVTADDPNLRCWDQKRRFGIDFLYRINRYVTALTQPVVPNRGGELVDNPLFTNPGDHGGAVRDPSMVFLTAIVGVPWQDIARRNQDGKPDVLRGLDPFGKAVGGFQDANELRTPDELGHYAWEYVVGDPAAFVAPIDPFMIESTAPRTGANPITGDAIAPPSSAPGPGPSAINGHEYTPSTQSGAAGWPNDLQYACTFDLPLPRDCSDPGAVACDCTDPLNDNPLCEADPATGERTLQVRAKACPGIRQLALVEALGAQGIAASICPVQTKHPGDDDYGLRPAMSTLVERIAQRLEVAVGGLCLPRELHPSPDGRVACTIVEGRRTGKDQAACEALCAGEAGRAPLPAALSPVAAAVRVHPAAVTAGIDCICEIPQARGVSLPGCHGNTSELAACQCDPAEVPQFEGEPVDGWCYVDPPAGAAAVLKNCPADQQRLLRFAGNAQPAPGGLVFIACD